MQEVPDLRTLIMITTATVDYDWEATSRILSLPRWFLKEFQCNIDWVARFNEFHVYDRYNFNNDNGLRIPFDELEEFHNCYTLGPRHLFEPYYYKLIDLRREFYDERDFDLKEMSTDDFNKKYYNTETGELINFKHERAYNIVKKILNRHEVE